MENESQSGGNYVPRFFDVLVQVLNQLREQEFMATATLGGWVMLYYSV